MLTVNRDLRAQRIEKGDVAVSTAHLRVALALLEITDPVSIDQLADEARASRRRGWWDQPRFRLIITPAMLQLLQFESQASAIRSFQLTLVSGLLQTPRYAKAVVDFWSEELSRGDGAARLELRLLRPEHVFGRSDPPRYLLTLDESVVLREVGGASVMAEQLRHLLVMMENPRITIRIMPLADAAPMASLGPFTIIDLAEDENVILYREGPYALDELLFASENIRRHRKIFEQMWERPLVQKRPRGSSPPAPRKRRWEVFVAGGSVSFGPTVPPNYERR